MREETFRTFIIFAGLTASVAIPTLALAGMSHTDYLSALQMAEAKAERTHGTALAATARAKISVTREFLGREYRVGDSWDVAAFAESSTMARKTNVAEDLPHLLPAENRPGHAGIFHYEVTGVSPAAVTVQVTQTATSDAPSIDPHVQSMTLTFDADMNPTDKVYAISGIDHPVHVSPEGVHSRITRLELFPLDPNELSTAARGKVSTLPALPPALGKLASINAQASDLTELTQDDFFGRPIRTLWKKGDPWPTYVSTINGAAVLLKKGVQE